MLLVNINTSMLKKGVTPPIGPYSQSTKVVNIKKSINMMSHTNSKKKDI
jgi:hypothetical protein